jgi:hypothetical protein
MPRCAVNLVIGWGILLLISVAILAIVAKFPTVLITIGKFQNAPLAFSLIVSAAILAVVLTAIAEHLINLG